MYCENSILCSSENLFNLSLLTLICRLKPFLWGYFSFHINVFIGKINSDLMKVKFYFSLLSFLRKLTLYEIVTL